MRSIQNKDKGYLLTIDNGLVFFEWIYEGKKYGMSFDVIELEKFKNDIESISWWFGHDPDSIYDRDKK